MADSKKRHPSPREQQQARGRMKRARRGVEQMIDGAADAFHELAGVKRHRRHYARLEALHVQASRLYERITESLGKPLALTDEAKSEAANTRRTRRTRRPKKGARS
jgi:hypothetical protein